MIGQLPLSSLLLTFHSGFHLYVLTTVLYFILICFYCTPHQACNNAAFCGFYVQNTHSYNNQPFVYSISGARGFEEKYHEAFSSCSNNRLQIVLDSYCRQKCIIMTKEY